MSELASVTAEPGQALNDAGANGGNGHHPPAQQVRGPWLKLPRLKVPRLLGVGSVWFRVQSGARVRISENAFPREEFRRFLTVMETWER